MSHFAIKDLIYDNPLAAEKDIAEFILEGDAAISFPQGRMRMENRRDPSEGQAANFVHWLNRDFPSDIAIAWDFLPIREPGLCIVFFAANGRGGKDLFDPQFAERTGEYDQYNHGDIDALHRSYFRRRYPNERAFEICNLRKSYGFHMVAQSPDPLPSVCDAVGPYRIQLVKRGPEVAFSIDDLPVLQWVDDGESYGPILGGGKIGFRQMAPLIAEYANLQVHAVEKVR